MKNIILTIFLLFNTVAMANTNVLLLNVTDNSVVKGSIDSSKVSIASISKLMTVHTVLKANQNLNETLTVQSKLHNHTRLVRGMKLTRLDLMKLSLVYSDNLAAVTLSENYPGGREAFMRQMNENSKELGMTSTYFGDPTGLDSDNSSTISDISILTNTVSKYQLVRDAAKTENLTVVATKGKKSVKIKVNPTSKFFGHDNIIAIKTGFTNAAGFCITMLLRSNDKIYNLVVLGAHTSKERKKIIEASLNSINVDAKEDKYIKPMKRYRHHRHYG
jgi:D-alanyl-D-alanine endopeptidase (penicillin-binding protein 7)